MITLKIKRVGTISMAVIMIGFGVILFAAQFSMLSAVEIATRLWPAILIIIGIEILYYVSMQKKSTENIIIKYDLFSIFIVTVILVVNIGLYGLMETGVLDYFKVVVKNETVRYERNINY
ncbi:LiaI-LiaF-like domain-containing protein [Sedimentibacter sp.]|uniref:LiaI-LiaF-like domain-containing protein n=1 Tax=Sedimentibacter sp. TaxID=1960295 RepID=UPI0028A1ABC3|nr:DUF5668 domain-containing protein [Sedimentibacter sp.]